jgi:hypothetical protein
MHDIRSIPSWLLPKYARLSIQVVHLTVVNIFSWMLAVGDLYQERQRNLESDVELVSNEKRM